MASVGFRSREESLAVSGAQALSASTQRSMAATLGAIVGLCVGVGLLLTARRVFGSASGELSRDVLLLAGLAITSAMAAVRIAWRKLHPVRSSPPPWSDWLIGCGSSLAVALWCVGCCYPGERTSDWLIWLPLLVADQFWRQTFFDADRPETLSFPLPTHSDSSVTAYQEIVGDAASATSDHIVQQLYRVREPDGRESVYGTLRVEFLAGQRTATQYVGFCPPLSHLPDVEADPLDAELAQVRVVQALAHGVRLDIRLSEAAEEAFVLPVDMAAVPAVEVAARSAG